MINSVETTLNTYAYSLCGKKLVLAVSGGIDSMAMFHFFVSFRGSFGVDSITAAHFNHGLRGKESDSDEELVKKYAESLDVPFISGRSDMLREEKPKGHSVESWARELRYGFLRETAKAAKAVVATAHNANDNAETVLFHLMRGTGLRGAAGIPFENDGVFRPFLNIPRTSIERYVSENEVPFAVDKSNFSDDYSRNRIRNVIIPELVGLNDKAVENINHFSSVARETDDFLREQAAETIDKSEKDGKTDAKLLPQSSDILTKYVIIELCEKNDCTADRRVLADLTPVLRGDKTRAQIDGGHHLINESGFVFVQKGKEEREYHKFVIKAETGANLLPDGTVVFVRSCDIIDGIGDKTDFSNAVDTDKIRGRLVLRNRENGDCFKSFRRGQTKSLKKLFNERGIPPRERDAVPLLADDEGILWIASEGVSERAAPGRDTAKVLFISLG